MAINFNSQMQTAYLNQGRVRNDQLIDIVHDATGIKNKLVEATRHTIISGAPGVGKTYTTLNEIEQAGIRYTTFTPDLSDIQITVALAYFTYQLKDDEELVVVIDDADDVVFGDLKTLNKWKLATADSNPQWTYGKDITTTLRNLEKQDRPVELAALQHYSAEGGLGVQIPLDRVRFVILCNTDLENPRSLSKKLFSSVDAVLDRFHYERLEMPWQEKWGWLAYILSNTQPFDIELNDEQKKELLVWLFGNWDNLKSQNGASYRSVRKMAAFMLNEPDNYLDKWQRMVK